MTELIFTGYGIDIIKRNDDYYVRYDDGTVAMFEKESKITFVEALKAQRSERDAYEVIIATQSREGRV
ncbi:hypothetical protein KYI92_00075 [Pantoea allii]|uniref:KTSC domain-containing protein n=1 Tax=Pantoea allii TaxID=574096 RepID=A0ABS6V947_9GAMM|nr:hypothetical protein [Pantoea allii]MBW1212747.1 hypothetical protein [Pantoea allii]MBW1255615.1 hypothetical protein [Pantoea allii]MBW1264692.1 hypothetical protein [Pantoea allii]MBW1286809.1 hypothetical protein [Pantoea allii]